VKKIKDLKFADILETTECMLECKTRELERNIIKKVT
jgi:hypothetical protein